MPNGCRSPTEGAASMEWSDGGVNSVCYNHDHCSATLKLICDFDEHRCLPGFNAFCQGWNGGCASNLNCGGDEYFQGDGDVGRTFCECPVQHEWHDDMNKCVFDRNFANDGRHVE
eukprot:748833_1